MKLKSLKKSLITLASISASFMIPATMISCSKTQNNNITQEMIDNEFEKFNNSLLKKEFNENIYLENFNFDQKGEVILTLEQISQYIAIENLSNSFIYKFIVKKNESNNSISIEMLMNEKNSNNNSFSLRPSDSSLSIKEIKNIKTLTSEQILELKKIFSKWKEIGNKSIKIKNTKTNESLDENKYANILPSYLTLDDIEISFDTSIFAQNIDSKYIKINHTFNDVLGEINLRLQIINDKTNLPFYFDQINNFENVVVAGFAKQIDRDKEVESVFKKLSNTFDLNTLIKNKTLPFLSSGVITINDIKELLNAIKTNVSEPNEKINDIIDLINNLDNTWFNLSYKTNASDANGTLSITWSLVDKFTGYIIYPQNISKITTINNMIKLTIENKDENENTTKDNSQLKNGYDAYQLFKNIKLKDINKFNVNTFDVSQINNKWLIDNTNIKDVLNNFNENGEYIEFSLTTNKITNNFRFKCNKITSKDIIKNDVMGSIEFNINLEIELSANFDGNEGDEKQWIKFMPPKSISYDGTEVVYESAAQTSSLKIGGFLTNTIIDSSILYKFLETNSTITVEIPKESKEYFDYLLNACVNDESQILVLLSNEIKSSILSNFNSNDLITIEKLLNEYDMSIDLTKNNSVSYDQTLKQFSNPNPINFKLVSKQTNENSQYIELPYFENGVKKPYPKVTIVVMLN